MHGHVAARVCARAQYSDNCFFTPLVEAHGHWGDWGNQESCPPGTFATKFRTRGGIFILGISLTGIVVTYASMQVEQAEQDA